MPEPRFRAPAPQATPARIVGLVSLLREQLSESELVAGADTIGWHLTHQHQTILSQAMIHRILHRHGAVVLDLAKRPNSSYLRFPAEVPKPRPAADAAV